MTRSPSGRIVVKLDELDIDLKRNLYACLAKEGKTLKEWFVEKAHEHVRVHGSPLRSSSQRARGML
jgi:hypothetical protein